MGPKMRASSTPVIISKWLFRLYRDNYKSFLQKKNSYDNRIYV